MGALFMSESVTHHL